DPELAKELAAQVHDALLDLERAADEDQPGRGDHEGLPLEPLGCDDDVDQTRFVLEREEDESLGGSWPLPADDQPGHGDVARAVGERVDLAGGANAVRL